MSGKTQHNWHKLHTEFINSDFTRRRFFKKKGIKTTTWKRHADVSWDHDQEVHRQKISERAKEKLIERGAESAAQVLMRHQKMGRELTAVGLNNLFVDVVDENGVKTGKKKLREDMHASDVQRLLHTGINAEYRAALALERLSPTGTTGTPTADNADALKGAGPSTTETQADLDAKVLEAQREALRDPKKAEAAFEFIKSLGFKSDAS